MSGKVLSINGKTGTFTMPEGDDLFQAITDITTLQQDLASLTTDLGTLDDDATKMLARAELKANSAAVTSGEVAGGTDILGASISFPTGGKPIILTMSGGVTVVGGTGVTYGIIRILDGDDNEVQRVALTSPASGTHFVSIHKTVRIPSPPTLATYKVNAFKITCTSVGTIGSDTSTNKAAFALTASTGEIAA